MCYDCATDAELADCAFDADEYHPQNWPDDATLATYPDELPEPHGWHDEKGKPYDSNWRLYNPYQGSQSPTEGRCNALLSSWKDRYGAPRYCTRLPEHEFIDDGSEFCKVHKSRDALMKRARDLFEHGLHSKTVRHVFDKLDAWQKVTVLGWWESYIDESVYDFGIEWSETTVSDSAAVDDNDGPVTTEGTYDALEVELDEETVTVGVPVPQEHETRCFALFRAAVMDMKAGLADRVLLDTEDGTTAMEREQTVSVTDEGQEITDEAEHHLNLPVSRLDKDRTDVLAFGGVPVDGGADVEVDVSGAEELVMDLTDDDYATPTAVDHDPVTTASALDDN